MGHKKLIVALLQAKVGWFKNLERKAILTEKRARNSKNGHAGSRGKK